MHHETGPPGPAAGTAGAETAEGAQLLELKRILGELGKLRSFRDPLPDLHGDLTSPQVHTILWLGVEGALPTSVVARRVGCAVPTQTGVVDRLEKLGHVVRERDPADRRVVLVRLTDSGRALFALIDEQVDLHLGALLGAMDEPDRATLVSILGRIVARFSPAGESGGEPAAPLDPADLAPDPEPNP